MEGVLLAMPKIGSVSEGFTPKIIFCPVGSSQSGET